MFKKIKDKIVEHYENKGGCSCSVESDACCTEGKNTIKIVESKDEKACCGK